MGWVMMSERELNRIEVLAQVDDGRLSVENGANMLDVTKRQMFRLLKRYRTDGAPAIRHRARGKTPNNKIHKAKRDFALAIVKENYADFGPTLAAEMLVEHHGFKVSRETLRKWMQEDGIWLSRKQRRTFHQPRLRRECYGELIQIDGSDHRWFEDRADPCTLLVFIDDATSMLMELQFVQSESTFSYFGALERYLLKHGRPVAFYSDKHSVFRVAKPNEHMTGMTQFGRALAELNVEILCANSSQAKGRVERANRTLQDRLVKELRLAGVSNMDDGNAFLSGFMKRFNTKFAKAPAKPDNLHRALNIEPERLAEVFCLRDKRYVTKDLTLKYDRKRIKLEVNDLTRGLVGKYIDVYEMADGRIQVRAKGVALPHMILNPERRITHAAITENKRLGAVLAHIKDEQDKASLTVKVKPVSAKNGYKKTGRRSPGRPSKMDAYYAQKRADREARAASQTSDV
ncbi:integrase-like protein [Litoreibacter halocynthiae]|uniref:Integrase-like protein n=2 Tax=Litoreibacter TaxID=947567 RepID=A0A4R7LJQ9_9RHOB|nr:MULTISPECIES: ISNCY family transposase [Litoreibacter]RLJ40682.1 integrase-like protein [Litoreibacter meonggei]TDT74866.1 integrase-like protein [Litoreibacter halocynthiae]